MISLLEIANSIDEAEMKLKPKGGGKVVVFKNKDNYEDALKSGNYEEPEGSKKVKSKDSDMDFGRAADDEADDMDRDARFDAEDDNEESDDIEISDANSGPIDRDDIMDMLKNDSEVVDKMGDDVYWDGMDLVSSKFDDDTIAYVDGNMTLGDLKKQIMDYEEMSETIKVDLKAKYDEIFRSLK